MHRQTRLQHQGLSRNLLPARGALRRRGSFRIAFSFTATLVPALLALTLVVASRAQLAAQQPRAPGFRSYNLRYIQADDAATRMRTILSDLGSDAEVLVDRAENRILVGGDEQARQLAAQFVQLIDQPEPQLQPADPRVEASQVRGYRIEDEPLEAAVARLRERYPPSTGVRIASDPRINQVIVVAPAAVQREIAALYSAAGIPPAERPTNTAAEAGRTLRLQHITWRELEDDVQRIWGPALNVTVSNNGEMATVLMGQEAVLGINRRDNSVTVLGSTQLSETWTQVISALDHPRSAADQRTQLIPLAGADPGSVRRAVSVLQEASRRARSGEATAAVPLGSAPQANWGGRLVSMIFQQENGQPLTAQPEAGQTDQPAPAGEQPDLDMPLPGEEGGGGLLGPVQIEFLEGLDVIIIRGRQRDVQRVQQIIEDIQRLSEETRPIIEVYYLRHVNGQSVATLITELYEEAFLARQGQVSIRALVEPNAILLIGRDDSVALVKELIQKLDRPAPPSSRFVVFRLKHVSAVDAEQTVRNFFVTRPGLETEPRPGLGTQVQVIADYRSNSLIVQASPRDLAEAQRLIESIDVDDTPTSAEIRVFPLRNALAQDLAQVLQSAISGQAAVGALQPGQQLQPGAATQAQSTLPSASLEFMMIDQESKQLLRSGILADVLVTADANINALIVRAPASSMELIAALIQQLDRLPDAEARIKVFTLVNGDATNLTAMLQQLFGQQVTAGQGTAQFAFGFGGQAQLPTVTAGGDTSLVPLRFAVDVRTNSIIASGSEGDLQVVETVLYRLDEGDIEARILSVVRLKHAPAEDVANSITAFLQSQQQLFQQLLLFNQAISPFEQIEREVIVVPELVTNSLIVSATPRYHDEIMQVIRDLDFRPPMVMVQVLIAEVALDDFFEFGLEMGLQDSLLFDRGIAGTSSNPGFNFNRVGLPNLSDAGRAHLAGQGLSTFGLGTSNSALGYGGLVLSAANESINVLIRALQDAGRLQILSRPQIMTLNNQQAFVQVGADVSRITGTTITQGIVQNNVEDVQTGLILRVTPLINDDGIVVMNLDAERSRLGAESEGTVVGTDQNGNPIISPPIDRTTAQTTISAKSGQTVVFAGLITKDKTMTLRRIPWVSDLPLIGRLFEFESTGERRTELLIVMTPYLITADEDYEFIKAMETQRMSYCLADVIEIHGDVGLQGGSALFCCGDAPVIFPHVDPSGSEYLSGRSPEPASVQLAPLESNGPAPLSPIPVSRGPVTAAPPVLMTPQARAPGADWTRDIMSYGPPQAGEVQRANYATSTDSTPLVQPLQRLPVTEND